MSSDKDKAILFGPILGELFWELFRFYPIIPYIKEHGYKSHKQPKIIVLTRPDRFDIYGKYANILVPLRIKENGYVQDCFGLRGFKQKEFNEIITKFKDTYSNRFKIIDHLYPDISGRKMQNKNQFPHSRMKYKYKPRNENRRLIDEYIPQDDDRKIVVLGPRFRKGLRRNWPYFNQLYDLIGNDKELNKKFNFVICGKNPDYVPDNQNRFYDVNNIEIGEKSSLIGLTFEIMKDKRTILTIGSQSAIPNISMLFGLEVLQWGHQKSLHTRSYNIRKTKVHFIDDHKYSIKPEEIFNRMKKILKGKE